MQRHLTCFEQRDFYQLCVLIQVDAKLADLFQVLLKLDNIINMSI